MKASPEEGANKVPALAVYFHAAPDARRFIGALELRKDPLELAQGLAQLICSVTSEPVVLDSFMPRGLARMKMRNHVPYSLFGNIGVEFVEDLGSDIFNSVGLQLDTPTRHVEMSARGEMNPPVKQTPEDRGQLF